ncbi:MAG: Gfo/Idh/MocA family oxidoreductase [Thaumarchaeota archaeon]|nr:Gfo/Idh/MocA family oxidoreductase [Nitrososphaerota archaeon]
MGKPLRVAVIGLGVWGEKHIQALKTIPEAELVAICDTSQARLNSLSAQYKVPNVYSDFHELLAREELDAVHVVTPEPAHRDPVLEAASRGVHVLVEKPLATSLEDADAMIASAEKNKTILMVGHVLRWDARYAMAKDYIDRGEMGTISSIFARRSVSRSQAPVFLSRSTPVMQLGIHDIDLILWYTQGRVKQVYARSSRLLDFKYPDSMVCLMDFEDGSRAVVQNSFALPETLPYFVGARMEILGQKSFMVLDASEQSLFISDERGYQMPDTTLVPMVRKELVGTLRQEIEYFARCVLTGTQPTVIRPSESRNALEVALACERSLADDRPVKLG